MNNKITTTRSILVAIAAFAALPAIQLNAQEAPVQAPKALSQQAPAYSYQLRRDEVVGKVVVAFVVTPSGDVADAAIVSSTASRLDRPTLVALSKWKYAPATKAGVPVTAKVIETVKFEMPEVSL